MADINIDLSVGDIYSSMSSREINELIEILKEDGRINNNYINKEGTSSNMEMEWEEICFKLLEKRLLMSNKDEEIIRSISNKY